LLPGRIVGPDFRGSLVAWAFLCKYVPLLFAALAASRLSARRGYRLAYAGALLLILGSVWTLLETFGMFIAVMAAPGRHGGTDESTGMGLLGVLLGGAGVVAGLVGAIKTLITLGDPAIRRVFR
jgi:hypothetical protein